MIRLFRQLSLVEVVAHAVIFELHQTLRIQNKKELILSGEKNRFRTKYLRN
jgi:hypothetical protein